MILALARVTPIAASKPRASGDDPRMPISSFLLSQ